MLVEESGSLDGREGMALADGPRTDCFGASMLASASFGILSSARHVRDIVMYFRQLCICKAVFWPHVPHVVRDAFCMFPCLVSLAFAK